MKILQSRTSKVVLVKHNQIPITKLLTPKYIDETRTMNSFGNAILTQDQLGNVVGAVFSNGIYNARDGKEIVIKDLSIENRKVQFNIDGSSNYADEYFEHLKIYLTGITDYLGDDFLVPVISVDDTEVVSNLNFSLSKLFSDSLYHQINENFLNKASSSTNNLAKARLSNISVNFQIDYEPVDFAKISDTRITVSRKSFSIQAAVGYGPDDKVYYSKAPISTDLHLQFLGEIENSLQ